MCSWVIYIFQRFFLSSASLHFFLFIFLRFAGSKSQQSFVATREFIRSHGLHLAAWHSLNNNESAQQNLTRCMRNCRPTRLHRALRSIRFFSSCGGQKLVVSLKFAVPFLIQTTIKVKGDCCRIGLELCIYPRVGTDAFVRWNGCLNYATYLFTSALKREKHVQVGFDSIEQTRAHACCILACQFSFSA